MSLDNLPAQRNAQTGPSAGAQWVASRGFGANCPVGYHSRLGRRNPTWWTLVSHGPK